MRAGKHSALKFKKYGVTVIATSRIFLNSPYILCMKTSVPSSETILLHKFLDGLCDGVKSNL